MRVPCSRTWTRGAPPLQAFVDFAPGPALQPPEAGVAM
jgi:hypothetical protein